MRSKRVRLKRAITCFTLTLKRMSVSAQGCEWHAGSGGHLRVYQARCGSLLLEESVFRGVRIHGIYWQQSAAPRACSESADAAGDRQRAKPQAATAPQPRAAGGRQHRDAAEEAQLLLLGGTHMCLARLQARCTACRGRDDAKHLGSALRAPAAGAEEQQRPQPVLSLQALFAAQPGRHWILSASFLPVLGKVSATSNEQTAPHALLARHDKAQDCTESKGCRQGSSGALRPHGTLAAGCTSQVLLGFANNSIALWTMAYAAVPSSAAGAEPSAVSAQPLEHKEMQHHWHGKQLWCVASTERLLLYSMDVAVTKLEGSSQQQLRAQVLSGALLDARVIQCFVNVCTAVLSATNMHH